MSQVSDITELFSCGVKRKSNKFVQSTLKKTNCIIDFITQNVLSIGLSSSGYGGKYKISIFLCTFKFFDLYQLAQFITR
ncbi:hypothetical protein [Wolbachia endosymbiont of Litomosoides brasiliensis]|uniref:hypothetical protein n=1 Tax=Wolbachia endosymbiont of Litomosoides brasiliensis TaxID=1812117 RepID=UPI00397994F1